MCCKNTNLTANPLTFFQILPNRKSFIVHECYKLSEQKVKQHFIFMCFFFFGTMVIIKDFRLSQNTFKV